MTRQDFWKVFNEKYADLFGQLFDRWQDEKEYENINDYLICLQENIKEDVEIYAITKRPFAIKIKCEDGNMRIRIKNDRFNAENIK